MCVNQSAGFHNWQTLNYSVYKTPPPPKYILGSTLGDTGGYKSI